MALEPGRSSELTVVVDESMTADRMGNQGVNVFATPELVHYFEAVAVQALEPYLEPGQGSVGTRVDVRHLAATPVGMEITFRATLTEVDGRRLTFRLEAEDEKERVGEGTHERFLVDMAKFLARIQAKTAG
ncbi:MAG: thioesterase [Streptosporangiales bacterium]|nr:thioesterase [Streptosporangiales bacterium]